MSMIIYSVKDVGNIRILFEGDKHVNDGLFEVALDKLRSKAYLMSILHQQYPDVVSALFGKNSNAYGVAFKDE